VNTAAAAPDKPVRWVTAVVLATLADHQLGAGAEFTAPSLAQWTARELTPAQRVHASTRLCALGFVTHSVEIDAQHMRVDSYRITPAGAAAIAEAAAGHVRKSGPKGTRKANPVDPGAMASRVWHLMRQRGKLDADEAAQLLCDAGDPKRYASSRGTIQRYLRRWTQAGFLTESAKRVGGDGPQSNGFKRYVMTLDNGPTPPAWRQILKAQAASKAPAGPQEGLE
jgi:DNA-binding PadR family transcriptional regulator